MNPLLTNVYNKAVTGFKCLPHGLHENRISTSGAIRICKELGVKPSTLIDVGANNSQWAKWIKKEYPSIRVISFEPIDHFNPIGEVHRIALSDVSGEVNMKINGCMSHVVSDGMGDTYVKSHRFDELMAITFDKPAILKIDCENFTFKALKGFGSSIHKFFLVVVEIWNDFSELPQYDPYQQQEIIQHMLTKGFNLRLLDSKYTINKIPYYDMAFYKI